MQYNTVLLQTILLDPMLYSLCSKTVSYCTDIHTVLLTFVGELNKLLYEKKRIQIENVDWIIWYFVP